jgi:hypothetical protein
MKRKARSRITCSTGLAATYRPPARIASPTCSRGIVWAVRMLRHRQITAMTTRNEAALIRKTVPELVAASTMPPIAGPTALARFWFTDPNEIACWRSSGGTSSGCSTCQVGAVRAEPVPTAKTSASSTHGVTRPARASAPRAAAASSISACETSSRCLRSKRSPAAPASTANITTGKLDAVWTSATYVAEPVSVSISHCAPTVCIQLPMLLTNCALHIAANQRWRNGAQAETGAGGRPAAGVTSWLATALQASVH